ncbi:hypothetical protein [Amycolatopsis sp. MtRt-6]|nr:hypothetical protein [Amycolatopsis sp. MtRt-6]
MAEDPFTGRQVGTLAAARLAGQLQALGATVTTDQSPVAVRELY